MAIVHREGLSPEVIPYEAAIAAAGRLKALADAEQDRLAATRGTRAVADAACRPGGPAAGEIEALYIRLRDRAGRGQAGRSGRALSCGLSG